MKRILFLIDSLPGGGAEKVLVDIVENLDKDKFNVTVMTSIEGGGYVEKIKQYCEYKPFFKELKTPKNLIDELYNKLIRKFRYLFLTYMPSRILHKFFIGNEYDIEVAFLEGHATKVISGSQNKRSKKYAWVHIDLMTNNWSHIYYKSIEKQIEAYKVFDRICCVSNHVRDAFIQLTGLNENVVTQYNPVNEVRIRQLAEQQDEKLDSNILNLVTVGRLTPQKGYDRLLEVHRRLVEEGFDYHLFILGEGEDRFVLEEFIRKNHLTDSVTLLGFKSNPYAYIKQADLFVCSSRSEGFSTVATESTILEIPIVTTSCSGMNELLGDSEYGLITENDTDSLYDGLKELLTNKALYLKYQTKIKERSKDFILAKRMEQIEKMLLSK